jgi:hypothetical protein
VKGFLNNLKQYVANIRCYANICKRIFACMRIFASEHLLECEIRIKLCEFRCRIFLKQIFAIIRKSHANIRFEANIRCNKYFFASNRICVCEYVRIF